MSKTYKDTKGFEYGPKAFKKERKNNWEKNLARNVDRFIDDNEEDASFQENLSTEDSFQEAE